MRNLWLKEIMEGGLKIEKQNYDNYSTQLDAFVEKIEWPKRPHDERHNELADPDKCQFLSGIQAVLELYYYGVPNETVCLHPE